MVNAKVFLFSSVAMAAVRSCGAFVGNANAPRCSSLRTAAWAGVRRAPTQPNRHTAIAPCHPTLQREVSLRAATSSALRSATKVLQPLVVCGPSGVGKGTIISRFMEGKNTEESSLPKFGFSVSHTTRQPRPGEVDGEHYHFVSREFMQDKVNGNFFIEWAEVHGNIYGTSFQSILDVSNIGTSGGDSDIELLGDGDRQCLLDIDVEGVRSIKEFQSAQQHERENEPMGKDKSTQQYSTVSGEDRMPELDAKFIFIAPPSVDVLRERLVGRGTETPETLERRFQNAKAELEYGLEPGNFDAVVVNDDLVQACEEFEAAIEKMYCSN
ncbi:hypothetical protein ACHAXT_000896 [Thalassiosira profunda]